MAGTFNRTISSYNGYQYRSVRGGSVQYPPDGSGFRLQATNPSSSTARRSSGIQLDGGTPGDCGSWQTPTKFQGNNPHTRWIRSLETSAQTRLVFSFPK